MLVGSSSPVVHLCRAAPCACQEGILHIHEFAALDTERLVDVCQHARLMSCRACWLVAGAAFSGLRLLAWPIDALAPCCWRGRCARRRPRHVSSIGYYREFDPDSESEADDAERPCHAIFIGVLGDRCMRPFAPQGFHDEAQPEPTTLFHEDAEVSDVGPRIECEGHQVPLCAHRHQLYLATLGPRKCVSASPLTPGWFSLRRRRGGESRSRSPSSASGTVPGPVGPRLPRPPPLARPPGQHQT